MVLSSRAQTDKHSWVANSTDQSEKHSLLRGCNRFKSLVGALYFQAHPSSSAQLR